MPPRGFLEEKKKGTTRHRPMAHPVLFRYLSYSTRFAEYGPVHRLRRCPALFKYLSYSSTFAEYGPVHPLRRCPALFRYLPCSTCFPRILVYEKGCNFFYWRFYSILVNLYRHGTCRCRYYKTGISHQGSHQLVVDQGHSSSSSSVVGQSGSRWVLGCVGECQNRTGGWA